MVRTHLFLLRPESTWVLFCFLLFCFFGNHFFVTKETSNTFFNFLNLIFKF